VKAEVDAFIISRPSNIFYFTGSISGGILIVAQEVEPLLLAPTVNFAIAQTQVSECQVKSYTREGLTTMIGDKLDKVAPRTIGYDYLNLEFYERLRKKLGAELKASVDLVWDMRRVKDPEEQKIMSRAGEIADLGMEAVRESLKAGMREYEVAAEGAFAMMRNSAEGLAFSTIVASGPRSAYPHAGVTERRIKRGDLVTVDLGASYKEYKSDITRTFVIGKPTRKQENIYETVFQAYKMAFPEIKDGADGKHVDNVARAIIEDAGSGEHFVHSLGHGVGLEVHEPPSLSKSSKDTLRAGNVVTNEPGIYIPELGGVRIEDTILVTDLNPIRLTTFDRNLDMMNV
jgi:Xaa-Pro aminopeptidase